jgi:hypothetical protein
MADTEQTIDTSLNGLFNNTSMQYVFEFLAIYLFAYFALGFIFNRSDENGSLRLVRLLDVTVFIFVVIYLVIVYRNKDLSDIGSQLSENLNMFKSFADNPYSIFAVFLFIILLYSAIYLVRLPMTPDLKPVSIMIVENIALLMFIVLLVIDFFKYVLNIDLLDYTLDGVIDVLNPTTPPPVTTTPKSTPKSTTTPTATSPPRIDEVFNIRNNLYTYNEAKEICSIYGSQLATYDQIEESYNDGGEWCNYGWTDGQMALFPTQKSTWSKLQGSERTKNACGRPGINGGYIKNKNVRFGVNCYGKKPDPSDKEKAMMSANATPNIPVSAADRALQSKIDLLKNNPDKYLVVNSFNRTKWSETSR